ncbi:hypothetical protein [Burkholderia vietnamiensis]|uniref:hypothetical protein n=1 Tax=Burkholderia vietnamiensis TaxID=60552 RepID=UPI0012D85719|nr:hypothetical protein [Burkholderia vietnamiensis]
MFLEEGPIAPGGQYRKRDMRVPITDSQIVIVAAYYRRRTAMRRRRRVDCGAEARVAGVDRVVCYPEEYRSENRSFFRPALRC